MSLEILTATRLAILERIDHGHWARWPFAGISTSWLAGAWAQVDGTHAVNLIALAILGIGSSFLGLWRLYESQRNRIGEERRMSEIRIAEAERASFARVPISVTLVHPAVSEPGVIPPAPAPRPDPTPSSETP